MLNFLPYLSLDMLISAMLIKKQVSHLLAAVQNNSCEGLQKEKTGLKFVRRYCLIFCIQKKKK